MSVSSEHPACARFYARAHRLCLCSEAVLALKICACTQILCLCSRIVLVLKVCWFSLSSMIALRLYMDQLIVLSYLISDPAWLILNKGCVWQAKFFIESSLLLLQPQSPPWERPPSLLSRESNSRTLVRIPLSAHTIHARPGNHPAADRSSSSQLKSLLLHKDNILVGRHNFDFSQILFSSLRFQRYLEIF